MLPKIIENFGSVEGCAPCSPYKAVQSGKNLPREKITVGKIYRGKKLPRFCIEGSFFSDRPMADFALPKAVVSELEEIHVAKRKRNTFDDEIIRKVTDDARINGVARAATKYNAATPTAVIGESTVRDWLRVFKATGQYHTVNKRGRKECLTSSEKQDVFTAALKLRSTPSPEGLTAGTVAAVARGIVARSRPATLAKNDGVLVMGKRWANYLMKREN